MHPPLLHTQALQTVSQRGLLLQVSANSDWESGWGRGRFQPAKVGVWGKTANPEGEPSMVKPRPRAQGSRALMPACLGPPAGADTISGPILSLRRVYVVNKEICIRTVCAHEELLRGRKASTPDLPLPCTHSLSIPPIFIKHALCATAASRDPGSHPPTCTAYHPQDILHRQGWGGGSSSHRPAHP